MKKGLLLIERMVLESLSRKERNLEELSIDTGLDALLIKNVIIEFLKHDYVVYRKGVYSLNEEVIRESIVAANDHEYIKNELQDIFTSLVNRYFKEDQQIRNKEVELRVRKVWLDKDDVKIFNAHLETLEIFLKNIEIKRKMKPKNEKLCDQRILLWGCSPYRNIVEENLQAI